jgi:CHAD domain-containing protein
VQIEHTLALADAAGARPHIAPFVAWLATQRDRCREALLLALDDARFGQLTDRLQTGLASWHTGAGQAANVGQWAPPRIKRVFKKLRKAADDLGSDAPAEALHQVRIRAKRVRYTVEFFVPVYGEPAELVVKRAVALQDLLGAVQDGVVARRQMDAALQTAGETWPIETAFVLGQLAERQAARSTALRADFPKAYARVRRKAWRTLKARL